MDLGLAGKVAIVTGGSRGLGLAAAQALIAEGAHVVVCARGEEALKHGGRVLQKAAASGARVAYAGRRCLDRGRRRRPWSTRRSREFGGIDVLVNNVGAREGRRSSKRPPTRTGRRRSIRRCFPAIRMSRLAVPHIRKRGGGAIVIVSSIFGRESGGRMTYNAVKAAEISLTKSLAQQLAKDQIRVVSVAPGSILFEGGSWWKRQQADPEGIAEFVKQELPFGRFGTPEEVGAAIAFLASPKASWISGTTVVVDGCQSRMF